MGCGKGELLRKLIVFVPLIRNLSEVCPLECFSVSNSHVKTKRGEEGELMFTGHLLGTRQLLSEPVPRLSQPEPFGYYFSLCVVSWIILFVESFPLLRFKTR